MQLLLLNLSCVAPFHVTRSALLAMRADKHAKVYINETYLTKNDRNICAKINFDKINIYAKSKFSINSR
jgi:hypothetical protein